MTTHDYTEGDEAMTATTDPKALLREKIAQYHDGTETMGVVAMYEFAALHAGLSLTEIENLWEATPCSHR